MSKLSPLEAWEEVKDEMLEWTEGYEENFDIIENALKENEYLKTELLGQSQELELKTKVLEIIEKKNVNIRYLQECNFEYYNELAEVEEELTQEEYDLLREVLL